MNQQTTIAASLTIEQAKGLARGTILNMLTDDKQGLFMNADNKTPARFKVTSVKTWKRNASRVEIHVQRGMYKHYTITQEHLEYWVIQS